MTAVRARRAVARVGIVYLLHLSEPYGHARHYTGWTTDLDARLALHASGQGARLLAVAGAAGITWEVARTWRGGRDLERSLKRQGGASRRCPLCGVIPRPGGVGGLPRNRDGSVSRSRTSDAEKRLAGMMTAAQLAEHTALRRGVMRGRVPGVVRSTAPLADDPWCADAVALAS
jgi:predicted GIY-YIG superfamily endonuclease